MRMVDNFYFETYMECAKAVTFILLHFFKFLCMSEKPRLYQFNITAPSRSRYKLPWLPEYFHSYGEIPSRKGKYPMLRTNTKPHQLIKHAKISYSIVPLVFRKLSYRIYWNGLNGGYLKAEVLQVPPKVRTVLVRYLLSGIRILVYSCTGCGTSKIYLCLEDNRSSFSRVSLKSETKDARP